MPKGTGRKTKGNTRPKADGYDEYDEPQLDALATSEFVLLMQSMSPDEREAIGEILGRHSLRTYDGFADFVKDVMVLGLQGRIPLPLLPELRKWAELAFTSLTYATDKYNKSAGSQTTSILAVLQQTKENLGPAFKPDFGRAPQARPALPEHFDVPAVPERERILIEPERPVLDALPELRQ